MLDRVNHKALNCSYLLALGKAYYSMPMNFLLLRIIKRPPLTYHK
ncbi:hypothetical protein N752_04985 [Desulforamulus aquiferis]|nr:hypothetical protein N752_04985 [Desulforamulus aquiferis]